MNDGLESAIQAAGGSMALATRLGLVPSVIGNWRRRGGIPASQVPHVAKATKLPPPHILRPDLFDAPPSPAEALSRDIGRPKRSVVNWLKGDYGPDLFSALDAARAVPAWRAYLTQLMAS